MRRTREANELRLFVGGGGTVIGLDRRRKADGGEIVARPIAPRLGKAARSSEVERLAPSSAGGSISGRFYPRDRRRVRRHISVVALRFEVGRKGRDAEAEPRRERRVAEEIERKRIVLRHKRLLSNGRTRNVPPAAGPAGDANA